MTTPSLAQQLCDEIARLVPVFLEDPIDAKQSQGNAACLAIGPDGDVAGRIFGTDRARGRWCFGIAQRKVSQVWATGYATARFEELVFAGKLDEHQFGLSRPDFIGWEGGVPLWLENGSLLAAAFSGFRGIKDVEIVQRAARSLPGLRLERPS